MNPFDYAKERYAAVGVDVEAAMAALKDYQAQRKQGLDPPFKASSIGLEGKTDCWE